MWSPPALPSAAAMLFHVTFQRDACAKFWIDYDKPRSQSTNRTKILGELLA